MSGAAFQAIDAGRPWEYARKARKLRQQPVMGLGLADDYDIALIQPQG